MIADHLFQNVPDLLVLALQHLLGALDRVGMAKLFETPDDERLKQGQRFGKDHFDELLDRIREIRASERRFYLKITDIYEQCSIDYNKDADITQSSLKLFKINYTLLLPEKQQLRSLQRGLMHRSLIWACKHGKMHLKVKY